MKKISVLIPTLNSIQFLQDCIESVINQTLKELEIIIIDAGSTDGTLRLIEQYKKQDNRIQLLHSDQKSYGYQLNLGISFAKGEYIGVVESDDIIDVDMYRTLFEATKREKVDFVKSGFINYALTATNKEMILEQNSIFKNVFGKVIRPFSYKSLYLDDFYLWSGIYKKQFLVDNSIVFNESKGAAYQDIGFLFQVFVLAQKAIYLDACFYKYRRNNVNSSTYSKKAFSYLSGEYGYILNTFLKKNHTIDTDWTTYFYYKLFMQCCSRFRLLAYHDDELISVEKDILYLQGILREAYEKKQINISIWDTRYQMEFFCFLESHNTYAEYYKIQISAQKKYLLELTKQIKEFSDVVLVSSSKVQSFVYTLLLSKGINSIITICDNDTSKQGTNVMGMEIVSVEEACENSAEKAYVIANPRAKKELILQLNSHGIKNSQIFIYDLGCDWIFLS